MKDRPEGVETSSSEDEDEEEDEVFEIPQKRLTAMKNKRKSVSAEVYGLYNPKKAFVPTVVPKDDKTKAHIRELLL